MLNLTCSPPRGGRRPHDHGRAHDLRPGVAADANGRHIKCQMSNQPADSASLSSVARPRMDAWDAIVIGSGHNALVAAVYLARAGWSVLVLEQDERPGGAVRSEELTRPGLVHDVFATNMN